MKLNRLRWLPKQQQTLSRSVWPGKRKSFSWPKRLHLSKPKPNTRQSRRL